MGIAALVMGIVTIIVGIFGFFAGPASIVALCMGIAGIVLAAIGKHKKMACSTGGLVCSIIGTVFTFIPAIIWILALSAATVTVA